MQCDRGQEQKSAGWEGGGGLNIVEKYKNTCCNQDWFPHYCQDDKLSCMGIYTAILCWRGQNEYESEGALMQVNRCVEMLIFSNHQEYKLITMLLTVIEHEKKCRCTPLGGHQWCVFLFSYFLLSIRSVIVWHQAYYYLRPFRTDKKGKKKQNTKTFSQNVSQ